MTARLDEEDRPNRGGGRGRGGKPTSGHLRAARLVIRSPRKEGDTEDPAPEEQLQRLRATEVWEGAGARMTLPSGLACDRIHAPLARSARVPAESRVEKTCSADVSQPLPLVCTKVRGRRADGSMSGSTPA